MDALEDAVLALAEQVGTDGKFPDTLKQGKPYQTDCINNSRKETLHSLHTSPFFHTCVCQRADDE